MPSVLDLTLQCGLVLAKWAGKNPTPGGGNVVPPKAGGKADGKGGLLSGTLGVWSGSGLFGVCCLGERVRDRVRGLEQRV